MGKTRRRPRRQLGLETPAKDQLAQRIADVVALSLQQSGRESGSGGLSTGKQGLLASTLRLAEQNVADMRAFLRRREAEATAIGSRGLGGVASCKGEELNVCVICLDGDLGTEEDERVEALACGHVFHARCIGQWLLYRRVCPVDRRPVDWSS